MDYVNRFPELKSYFENADYTDVKIVDGKAPLRKFVASMLSYYPWWLVFLYRIRAIVAQILGLEKQEKPDESFRLTPEDVSLTPGEEVTFFIVRSAKDDLYWIAETAEDKHLCAYFCVVIEPLENDINRFHIITLVKYKHWTGPVYFNLIRPFHHLVVSQMARAGTKNRT